jgi:hypothetical protein
MAENIVVQTPGNLISQHNNIMNVSVSTFFTSNAKIKMKKLGKKYFKSSSLDISKRVFKMMRSSKIIFNPYTNRFIKKTSYAKRATKKRIENKYFNAPTFVYGGVILSRSNVKYSVPQVSNNLGYTFYKFNLTESIDDQTELEEFLFFFIQGKTNTTSSYKVQVKLSTESGGGNKFLFKTAFKWKPYQKYNRFIRAVAKGVQRLDNEIRVSPDAGEEMDEPNTFLEEYPISKIEVSILPDEFFGGCLVGKSYQKTILNGVLINDYASTGNNCLFVVVKKFLHNKCPKSNELRAELGLEKSELVSCLIIPELAEMVKCNIELYVFNEDKKLELHSESVKVEGWRTCMILYKDKHYSHIINKEYNGNKIRCKRCNRKIIASNMGKHICNDGVITYVNRYLMKDRMGKTKMRKYQNWFDASKIKKNPTLQALGKFEYHNIACDFETFPEENGNELVYAVGMYYQEEDLYKKWYGEKALEDFMNWIKFYNDENNIGFNIIFYNGAGFDYYFMYHYLLEKEEQFHTTPLMNGGRILQMNWSKNRTFDLFLFTCPNSLDACVNGFKITEDAKGVFPHNFPTKWADVYYKGPGLPRSAYPKKMLKKIDDPKCSWAIIPEYFDFKEECLTYLKSDVMCLFKVYESMRKELKEITGVDYRSYLTISQMSYDFNCSLLHKNDFAELPQDKKVYDMIDKSIYGGRTKPVKLRFENKFLHKKFMDCKGDDKKLIKLIKKVRKKNMEFDCKARNNPEDLIPLMEKYKKWEYLMPFDVKSLYPSTYPKPFPSGNGKLLTAEEYYAERHLYLYSNKGVNYRIWIDTQQKVNKIKSDYPWGIYEVDIKYIPKHIIPVLPQKNEFGNTCWDIVCRKSQFYTTIDLEEGILKGYVFEIKNAYVYKYAKCFLSNFVDIVYAKKKEQDVYKGSDDEVLRNKYNPAKRLVLKIILNSLYGKMIQRPVLETTEIIDSDEKNREFHKNNDWTSWDILGNGKMLLSGVRREFEGACNKPIQIGSFILSYSRVIMREYMDMCDPYRFGNQDKSMKLSFYYTDTDCLWISSLQKHLLEHKIGEELGEVEDELEGGICVDSYFICPKVYLAKYYLWDERSNKVKLKTKMRAKGHPSYCLRPEYYKEVWEQGSVATDAFVMLKKIRWKLNKKEINEGLTAISIKKLDCRRRLNRDTWKGRIKLTNGDTYPIGYFSPDEIEGLELFGKAVEEEEELVLSSVDELAELTDTQN